MLNLFRDDMAYTQIGSWVVSYVKEGSWHLFVGIWYMYEGTRLMMLKVPLTSDN